MSITGALVLLVVVWFLTLFIVLQATARTQGEAGEVVPGTHEGAPANFRLGRTMLIATLIALPIWGGVVAVIVSGIISIESLDWLGVLGERTPN